MQPRCREMRRHSPPPRRALISSALRLLCPPPVVAFPVNSPVAKALPAIPLGFRSPFPHFQGFDRTQIRHYAAEDSGKKTKSKIQRKSKSRLAEKKKKKARSRAPMTPVTSKLKKYKIKAYSWTLNDRTIRRWRAGKLHNAHGKAKVLKKLNFRV